MWPSRKIQLVASSAAPGIDGVRALLKGIQLDFCEVDPTMEDFNEGFEERWMEKPFDCTAPSASTTSVGLGPVTEVVYWPEWQEDSFCREKAFAQGIKQQSVQSFIHNILEDELILWVSEPTVLIEERPLLGHILNEAGFDPTIIWPTAGGKWRCERRQGLHWLIPESWFEGLMEKGSLGRETIWDEEKVKEKVSWVVRETWIDFYRTQDGRKFVGHLPRWPEPLEERIAVQNIAECLDLGVSWLDIRLALRSIWKNIKMADNMRWNIDDFGWNAGACGEELSAPSIEHVEDWWAR